MTDLEITKLCAEAMGVETHQGATQPDGDPEGVFEPCLFMGRDDLYDPLHDDAQAMALEDWLTRRGTLVKTATKVTFTHDGTGVTWSWLVFDNAGRRAAVCECVAKMMAKP